MEIEEMEDEMLSELSFKEKCDMARESIMDELRDKYKSKISSEKGRIGREQKFAESLDASNPAQRLAEEHRERTKVKPQVQIRLDRKTVIYVDRDKCIQNPDGTWTKRERQKQNKNTE